MVLTSAEIKQHARELGFDACGIAPAVALPELAQLAEWLARGYAGEMLYLHKSADARADIRRFLPSARSVIVTGTIYNTDGSGAGSREPGTETREPRTAPPRDAVRVFYGTGLDMLVIGRFVLRK